MGNEGSGIVKQKTIIPLGVFRGGTSAIAGILRHLGVYMGENFDPANNHEDLEFQLKSIPEIKAKIEERNKTHDVWGYKFPGTIFDIDKLVSLYRNPYFIAVMRDPFAIALSEKKYNGREICEGLVIAHKHTQELIKFILKDNHPTIIISYEKLLIHPEMTIKGIVEFLDLDVAKLNGHFEAAAKFIKPNGYQEITS